MPDTMTTTLGALARAEPALHRLAAQPVPVAMAVHVSRLLTRVRAETQPFHEQHQTLIRRFGIERDPTPLETIQGWSRPIVEVPPSSLAAFKEQFDELAGIPATLDAARRLTLAMLADVKISADDLLALGDLVQPDAP